MQNNINSSTNNTRRLIILGLITAICIILTYTPLGMIPLPFVSVTIAHVPVIIVSIIEGPLMGLISGCVFGVATLIKAVTTSSGGLDIFFINPLVSVLPRAFVGLVPYFVYKGFSKLNENFAISIGAALGSITNTVGCLGMIYVLYARQLILDENGVATAQTAGAFLASLVSVLSLVAVSEMVASFVIAFAIIKALKKALKY